MRYQFQRTVVVEGTKHHDGDVVYATSLPEGSIPGLLRMGHMAPFSQVEQQQPQAEPVASPEPVIEQAPPKKQPAKK